MATRNPADISQINKKCVDWYEEYYGQTCQKVGGVSSRQRNSAEIYGHDTWNGSAVVTVNPLQVEFPA